MKCPQCDQEVVRLCEQCGNCVDCCQCEDDSDTEMDLDVDGGE